MGVGQDLADLREIGTGEEFVELLERTIASTFTGDYWDITLAEQLATSASRSPALFAYYAALNLVDARVLFSKLGWLSNEASGLKPPRSWPAAEFA